MSKAFFKFAVLGWFVASGAEVKPMSLQAWLGHVTTTTTRRGERSTETGIFYYDVHSRKAMRSENLVSVGDGSANAVVREPSCHDPFAALAAARRTALSSVDGEHCTVWVYGTPSHSASFCVSSHGVPIEWTSTYRYRTDGDGPFEEVSETSTLKQVRVGPLPPILGKSGDCMLRSVSGIPWQCDCEANPERCTGAHFDIAECTRLVEIAEAVGFKEDDPIGSPSNLLLVDPVVSHTIGCYCCWGRGLQCDDAAVTSIRWSGLGLLGTIPGQINQMTGLRNLELTGNSLSGQIPHLELPSLESFYAQRNMLTGGFPTGTLPGLWRLYIDHNQLTGALPHGLDKSMPSLRRLGVGDNRFTGSIPSDIPFWNNSNAEQRQSSIMCDFGGNPWSCPIEAWMRAGDGYSCEDVACADRVLV